MNIKTLGVLGAGQMGAGIAQIAASKGMKVILCDIKMEYCTTAIDKMKASFNKRIIAGKMTSEDADKLSANISTTIEIKDMASCDFVIEAIIEDLQVKNLAFQELSQVCGENTILCSNTSSISISKIASGCINPTRVVGMHFFFPLHFMKLVEIIRGNETSDKTCNVVKEVATILGKTSVECLKDTPGFIVNRCLFAFVLEAIHCYEDGVATPEDIDIAIKLGLNHPMGPFEIIDFSGIDLFPNVCNTLKPLPTTTWDTPESINKLIEAGKLGRKSGEGWYNYKK